MAWNAMESSFGPTFASREQDRSGEINGSYIGSELAGTNIFHALERLELSKICTREKPSGKSRVTIQS